MVLADDSSAVSKICFATLAREAKRRPDFISGILRSICQSTGFNQRVMKAFFTGDLISDLQSVKTGFELYESLPSKEEKMWVLKPCINSNPSPELD